MYAQVRVCMQIAQFVGDGSHKFILMIEWARSPAKFLEISFVDMLISKRRVIIQ